MYRHDKRPPTSDSQSIRTKSLTVARIVNGNYPIDVTKKPQL